MKKGISPLVAAVLLIAATMSIAGILAYWATSYVKTSLPPINETEIQCRQADFRIYKCSYDIPNQKINMILENIKGVELKDLKLFVEYPTGDVSSPISLNETLPGGILKTYVVTSVSNFSKVIVKTGCPELMVTSDCK